MVSVKLGLSGLSSVLPFACTITTYSVIHTALQCDPTSSRAKIPKLSHQTGRQHIFLKYKPIRCIFCATSSLRRLTQLSFGMLARAHCDKQNSIVVTVCYIVQTERFRADRYRLCIHRGLIGTKEVSTTHT